MNLQMQMGFYETARSILDEMLAQGIHYPLSEEDRHKECQRISESLTLLQPDSRGGGRVLDIGLGTGVMVHTVRQVCGVEVFAIEQPTRSWLHDPQWRQYVLRDNAVQVVATDVILDGLPFQNSVFEAILFTEVLEHLPVYPESLLGEMHRVLKAGGKLLLTTPNFASLYQVVSFIRGREISLYGWDVSYDDDQKYHPHVHEFTLGELRRLLSVTGFEIEAVHYSLWSANTADGLRGLLRHAIWRILPYLRPGLMVLAHRT